MQKRRLNAGVFIGRRHSGAMPTGGRFSFSARWHRTRNLEIPGLVPRTIHDAQLRIGE
jgi:hypothetical protein